MSMFPVVILAGGLATRLHPVTETIPKALVDIAGKPFIWRQLDYLRAQGVKDVLLCVGHLGETIQQYVGDGKELGLMVRYSFDGAKLLGTGGAIKKALSFLEDDFFILYGDSYLPVNFSMVQKTYKLKKRLALMTVLKNQDQWDKSNVLFVDGQLIDYNKYAPRAAMTYIDYGLAIVSAKVFEGYPPDTCFDLADVYKHLAMQNELSGFEVYERFYEIGSHQGLRETEEYFLNKGNV